MPSYTHELSVAIAAAQQAADKVMEMFGTAAVSTKPDGSFVTEADVASDSIIRRIISSAFPVDAILSEEAVDDRDRLQKSRCWVVDPLDRTSAFVRRSDDFDVYIALVVEARPVVATTLQPATGLMLTATAGGGARMWGEGRPGQSLAFSSPGDRPRLASRPWLGAPTNLPLLERVARVISPHASALCPDEGLGSRSFIPPDNRVDAIVGLASDDSEIDAWEWDLAAVDLIVREAGGCSTDLFGNPLLFNQSEPRLKSVLLSTDSRTHASILGALAWTLTGLSHRPTGASRAR